MKVQNIINFLRAKGWEQKKSSERVLSFLSPKSLDVKPRISINIPLNDEVVDYDRSLQFVLNTLSQIYQIPPNELNELLLSFNSTIFSIRIVEEETKAGKIGLKKFEDLLSSVKHILIDTADFVISKDNSHPRRSKEAKRYLDSCNFLQTEKGSFVAKVELPNDMTIQDEGIIAKGGINSTEVNDKIQDVLTFINDEIFDKMTSNVTRAYLAEYKEVINLRILKDFEDLYSKTQIQNIEFSLRKLSRTRTIATNDINQDRLSTLKLFIANTRKLMIEERPLEIVGRIVKLESRNPDGSQNIIVVAGEFEKEVSVRVQANLNSEDYKQALDFHKKKREVRLKGIAKREQKTYHMVSLEFFQEAHVS